MELIYYIAFAWFVMEFEPFQLLLSWIKTKLPNNETVEYLLGAFDCWKCFTFWLTLAVSWDFKIAVIASFIVFILEICLTKKK